MDIRRQDKRISRRARPRRADAKAIEPVCHLRRKKIPVVEEPEPVNELEPAVVIAPDVQPKRNVNWGVIGIVAVLVVFWVGAVLLARLVF